MRSDSQCLQHLASVVNSSASLVMKPFVHHLRGMNGILFLNRKFKCFRGISKYHHFRFTSVPGVIFVRVSLTAEEERIFINKTKCRFELFINQHVKYFQFRRTLVKRGSYIQLNKHVRPFCSDKFKACQLI